MSTTDIINGGDFDGVVTQRKVSYIQINYPTCTCEGVHELLLKELHHVFSLVGLFDRSVTGEEHRSSHRPINHVNINHLHTIQ